MNGLKEEIDKYKKDVQKLDSVQKELDEANKELATAKEAMANGDKSPYKVKFEEEQKAKEALQKEFDEYKADIASKAELTKKTDAYKKLLKEAGVSEKRIDAIMKVTDMKDVAVNEDGSIKDADALTESIKNEWADFIVTGGAQGVKTPNPQGGNGDGKITAGNGESFASKLANNYYKNLYGSKED